MRCSSVVGCSEFVRQAGRQAGRQARIKTFLDSRGIMYINFCFFSVHRKLFTARYGLNLHI
jgi:hypothetical protein